MECRMDKPIKLKINDVDAKPKTISRMIQAFSNLDILNSYGGYIFTFRIHNNITYLGIKPAILDGQRSNHFDLNAGPETKLFLTGSIMINGHISLLFKISKKEMNNKIKSELKELYIQFSTLLINNKYSGSGKFDWITKKIFEESELFESVPMTVYDLGL
jgi:hypothetical protein